MRFNAKMKKLTPLPIICNASHSWYATTLNGIACFFTFSLIIEGTTEKVLQFIIPLKSIYNENLGFSEQEFILEDY